MNSPKFPGESEFERIARELCFLQFSPPVSSQENQLPRVFRENAVFFGEKVVREKRLRGKNYYG